RVHVPLVEHGGKAILLEQAPASRAGQLAACISLQQPGPLDLRRTYEELEAVGQLRLPDVAAVLADALLVALLQLLGLEYALPPLGPAFGFVDRIPDALPVGLEEPGRQEPVLGHLVARGCFAVAELRAWSLDDLGEADHRDGVLVGDRPRVELGEEVEGLVAAAELRVVMLDVAGRELRDLLHLDVVDHG